MALQPIKFKSKIVLAKVEATEGTDAAPTGALNAMLLTDVQIQPMEGEDVSRNLELPHLGAQEEIATAIRVVLTGSFELVGSGTAGEAPAWGPLMRACAAAEIITPDTSVEYVPVSDDHEAVSIHFHIGPTRHVLLGAKGTGVISMNAQGIPVCRGTWTGLFVTPADQARPQVDLTAFQPPQVASKANTPVYTIDGISFIGRSYELNLGNDVQPRLLFNAEQIVVVDRAEVLSMTVQAVPLATYNPYSRAIERTRTAIVIEHGTVAGRKVRIETPTAVQRRPAGIENQQGVVEWPLTFTPLPTDAGDDQWTITLT